MRFFYQSWYFWTNFFSTSSLHRYELVDTSHAKFEAHTAKLWGFIAAPSVFMRLKLHTCPHILCPSIQWQVSQMAWDHSRYLTYIYTFSLEWLWSLGLDSMCTFHALPFVYFDYTHWNWGMFTKSFVKGIYMHYFFHDTHHWQLYYLCIDNQKFCLRRTTDGWVIAKHCQPPYNTVNPSRYDPHLQFKTCLAHTRSNWATEHKNDRWNHVLHVYD